MDIKSIVKQLTDSKTQALREGAIKEFLKTPSDTMPDFLFSAYKTIHVVLGQNTLEYQVMPDYLCLGSNDEYIHIPMSPITCKEFMAANDFVLPTPKMVKQIWDAAKIRPRVVSWGELYKNSTKKFNRDSTMCYVDHSKRVQELARQQNYSQADDLVAGHKKDVVLTNLLTLQKNKNNVAIYGWFNSDGTIVQGLNAVDHVVSYVDYSHGLRMIKNQCILNGKPTTLKQIWSDESLSLLVHDQPLKFQGY